MMDASKTEDYQLLGDVLDQGLRELGYSRGDLNVELFASDKQHVLDLYCSKGKNCCYKFQLPSFGMAYGNSRLSELGNKAHMEAMARQHLHTLHMGYTNALTAKTDYHRLVIKLVDQQRQTQRLHDTHAHLYQIRRQWYEQAKASTLKYLWPHSHWKTGRSPWLAPFCCCVRDISYRKLSAHGAAGVLWLRWVRLGACQKHVHVHPSLKDAALHKPNARRNIHTHMGSCKPAGAL